ncbi:hypothetical protein CROQUDRAFT_656431 [Cronartium quercuum f. sp. fusiforme G11]|uniref:Uncharacterized protein n=1 Tax=Cronartium quercuum f. sp. fusiforme G11 TaxID=708437 RepID=A0A9P6NK97_9BASI|nr:hypothetical protein CROQUDRAFT_656431 [Cronartium quercuum f. sp. fusiforme G11]
MTTLNDNPSTQYISSCAHILTEELNLLSRLIYLNKNQHRASIWFQKTIETYRWSKKILKTLLQPINLTQPEPIRVLLNMMSEAQARLLRSYGAIMQNVARTAFMANGLVITASISRLRSIYECVQGFLQHYDRLSPSNQTMELASLASSSRPHSPTLVTPLASGLDAEPSIARLRSVSPAEDGNRCDEVDRVQAKGHMPKSSDLCSLQQFSSASEVEAKAPSAIKGRLAGQQPLCIVPGSDLQTTSLLNPTQSSNPLTKLIDSSKDTIIKPGKFALSQSKSPSKNDSQIPDMFTKPTESRKRTESVEGLLEKKKKKKKKKVKRDELDDIFGDL